MLPTLHFNRYEKWPSIKRIMSETDNYDYLGMAFEFKFENTTELLPTQHKSVYLGAYLLLDHYEEKITVDFNFDCMTQNSDLFFVSGINTEKNTISKHKRILTGNQPGDNINLKLTNSTEITGLNTFKNFAEAINYYLTTEIIPELQKISNFLKENQGNFEPYEQKQCDEFLSNLREEAKLFCTTLNTDSRLTADLKDINSILLMQSLDKSLSQNTSNTKRNKI